MRRLTVAALALILAIGLVPQTAHAQPKNNTAQTNTIWYWLSHGQDLRLMYTGWLVGAGTGVASYLMTEKHGNPGVRHVSPGTAFAVTSLACIAVYPIVGTIFLNRPLTPREMYTGVGDCIVPFVGGWIVDSLLPHDAWTDGTPPKKVKGKHS
jgi:hypothetical protein